jgi:predicted ferric reductase
LRELAERLAASRGPLVLGALILAPLVLWARSVSLDSRFDGRYATLTSVAVLAAYAGTSAFALNLVLGARLRPVESFFGGLERMYQVHRLNGEIAFVLLLSHLVLVLASRATLATAGIAAWVYRSLLGNLLVRRRKYRVAAVNQLDDFVTEIEMEPRDKPLAHSAGQFLFVNFREPFSAQFPPFLRNQFHPFSITSAPGEPRLRITVKAVGDYTRALRALAPGGETVVEGPYGSFSSRDVPNERQIWIAGGIGVTPFLSMARSLNGAEPAVDFYYCVEHEPEAHFLDELRLIEAERDDFRVVVVPRDTDGFLSAGRLADENADLLASDVLICGPPAMIDNLRSQLRARGLAGERIHAEEFGFAKIGRRPETDLPPGVVATDPKTLASLAAVAFAGPALAIAILVAAYLAGGR